MASGFEVDCILGEMRVAVEAKATAHVHTDHLKGLRQLFVDHPEVARRVVVCLEPRVRRTADGIEILPVKRFCELLWGGELSG